MNLFFRDKDGNPVPILHVISAWTLLCVIFALLLTVALAVIRYFGFMQDGFWGWVALGLQVIIFASMFFKIRSIVKACVCDDVEHVSEALDMVAKGNLDVKADAHTTKEMAKLSTDINITVAAMRDYMEIVEHRMDSEMDFAAKLQDAMLPHAFPAFPDRHELEIFACMDAAKEVGGDFYDYYFVDDDRLFFCMADVSGKGVAAAMFAMKAKAVLKSYAHSDLTVDAIARNVNNAMCDENSVDMFVTVWLGYLNVRTGHLEYVNAGHTRAALRHNGGAFQFTDERPNLVFGGMEGIRYKKYERNLRPGDVIYLYTDGVTEATNANNELFGDQRLLESLDDACGTGVKGACDFVGNRIDDFVGEAPQFDDITMLCLRFFGGNVVPEIAVDATVENIPRVTEFVDEQLEACGCNMKAQMQIDIAIDELFGNIAQYAYDPEVGPAKVRVEVTEDPLQVLITFIDKGVPYDPLTGAAPNIEGSAEEREVGGLGVYMVKQTMDDVTYEYRNGCNILSIKKNLE